MIDFLNKREVTIYMYITIILCFIFQVLKLVLFDPNYLIAIPCLIINGFSALYATYVMYKIL